MQPPQHSPHSSRAWQARGLRHVARQELTAAIDALQRAVAINPALLTSWCMLERLHRMNADAESAALAAQQADTLRQLPRPIVEAGSLYSDGELAAAARVLRAFRAHGGEHVEAIRLLARIEQQRGVLDEAESLFAAAVGLAPDYHAARADFARVLLKQQKYAGARRESERLLQMEPDNAEYRLLDATACTGLGDHGRAITLYSGLVAAAPNSPHMRLLLAHSLQAVGLAAQALAAYQAAAAVSPTCGDVYWSLANFKTYRFTAAEIAHMRGAEAAADTTPVDRYHFCFALGKALEDQGAFADSWRYYERGNALKRAERPYDASIVEDEARRTMRVCTTEFLTARTGLGAPSAEPILIVGLPRSGSTLLEQILASHSLIEGTQELAEIPRIVRELAGRAAPPGDAAASNTAGRYPEVLGELAPPEFRVLGERYLAETRVYRRGKPFFIDKMPNNFRHIGLIHLMLPNARIIDMRREPTACCFSNLKQLFASGQEFVYGVEDLARYYCNYLDLMRHWNAVLPGRVLRIHYEDLVLDLDGEVRRLLAFLGLEFEAGCIDFHRTQRDIRTASSEQVRLPLNRDGLDSWRNYGELVQPLQRALSDARACYRE